MSSTARFHEASVPQNSQLNNRVTALLKTINSIRVHTTRFIFCLHIDVIIIRYLSSTYLSIISYLVQPTWYLYILLRSFQPYRILLIKCRIWNLRRISCFYDLVWFLLWWKRCPPIWDKCRKLAKLVLTLTLYAHIWSFPLYLPLWCVNVQVGVSWHKRNIFHGCDLYWSCCFLMELLKKQNWHNYCNCGEFVCTRHPTCLQMRTYCTGRIQFVVLTTLSLKFKDF